MSASEASLIIPTLNEELYLPFLLESLCNSKIALEVVVVDGNSEDRTEDVVKRFSSRFTYPSSLTFVQSEKRSISYQRNFGARAAEGSVLIFCDADVVFPSGSLEELLERFREGKYVVASPTYIPLEAGFQFKFIYSLYVSMQKILMLFHKPYFGGACVLTTRKAFESLGGFDESLLLGEDVDYSLRAAKLGRAKLIDIPLQVSARRIIKYGYSWVFSELPNIFRLLFTGKLKPETIYYPFGEYGGQKAHHVTKNTRGT